MQESWNNTNAPGNGRRQGRDESGGKREVADRSALKNALFTNLGHPTSEKLINKTTKPRFLRIGVSYSCWQMLTPALWTAEDSRCSSTAFLSQTFSPPPYLHYHRGVFSWQRSWLSVPFNSAMQRMFSSVSELSCLYWARQVELETWGLCSVWWRCCSECHLEMRNR